MRHVSGAAVSVPSDSTASQPMVRSIARRLGREPGRRQPVSIETDARLRAAHVRTASFRPELY